MPPGRVPPAGVCILSAFPADQTMQQIAAENKHPRTAFVVHRADGDFDWRWFTLEVEDDLCGHATLASAYVLALRAHGVWPVRFHTRSGVLTVARVGDSFEMDFPAWPPQPCDLPAELLPALGLKAAQIVRSRDYRVVVDRAAQVRALSPDIRALANLDIGIGGIIVTAPGECDVDYRFQNRSGHASEGGSDTLLPFHVSRTFPQNRRNVGDGAASYPVPGGTYLPYRRARVAWGPRRADSPVEEIDGPLSHLDADRSFTREHLLGCSPG